MGGIAKRTEVRVVGRDDDHLGPVATQTVQFFYCANHVADMLDHVDQAQLVERRILQRPGKLIQVVDDIGGGPRKTVNAEGSGMFFNPAPDIEDLQGRLSDFRHPSSVATAKSA